MTELGLIISKKVIGLTIAMGLSLCFSLLGMICAYVSYQKRQKMKEKQR